MAEIIPFLGIHYSQKKVGSLERVVGPPYDVIDTSEQNDLYAASPHNFVRIMLNRPEEGDSNADNPYTRAAGFLREWRQDGILVEDPVPAFYHYQQEFTNPADGARKTRIGLFCTLKLEPYAAGV